MFASRVGYEFLEKYNKQYLFFSDITEMAMKVYNKYHFGLLELAYESAMRHLLEQDGHKVEKQVYLPIYWDDVQLDQTYRMDLVVDEKFIVELKSIKFIGDEHRKQLQNYHRDYLFT